MTPDMLAVRRRLFEDFEFYAANALQIRTKHQTIEPLKLNTAQKILLEVINRQLTQRGYVRVIILKGRQMGLSTMIGGWIYWWVSQRTAQKAMVVTHEAKATRTLFDMTRRYHDKMPEILRPSTRYSSQKELVFDKLDSSYTLATSGSDSIGRSETITAAHLSETAFWEKRVAQQNFSGLMDTVPAGSGTAVFNESTANGMSGLFHEQWALAEAGESDFEPLFLPWFIEPGYCLPVPEGFTKSPVEERLVELYGLEDGHLVFRRMRVAEKGEDLFRQEYPCCAEEAFLTSGRPVFPPDHIAEMLKGAREPIAQKALVPGTTKKAPWVWETSRMGELRCFLPHDPEATYYIGADVGAGVRKDFSVAQVFDDKRRQAAVWRSDRVDPDFFGTVLAALGRFYNEALVICERNNHGILTNRVLNKDEAYPNVYTEIVVDKVTDAETKQLGFFTSEKTKPLVIGELRANIRDGAIEVYDRQTVLELQSYVVTESGKMEADKGTHDDTVIALALADHINTGVWMPVTMEEEWYPTFE